MFAITDGVNDVVAVLTPRTYGALPQDATYTIDGVFSYANGGESGHARLYFRNGILRQVFGFTGEGGTGPPREIVPQSGDTFTVRESWLDLDQSGRGTQLSTQQGGTLIFGDRVFEWKALDAAPGEYVVGFIVEDLDGNKVEAYTQVSVE